MQRGLALSASVVAVLLVGTGTAQESGAKKAAAPRTSRPDPKTTGTITGRITFPAVRKRRRRSRVRYPGQAPGARKGKKTLTFPAVVYVEDVKAGPATGAKAVMEQEGIAFDPSVLPVRLGTAVTFPNLDPVYHNVLSYSTAKRFDLGRYAKGETRTVTFDKPGVVRLACEIHAHMRGYVVVLAQPHFAPTDTKGRFRINGVPPGTRRLAMWHDRFKLVPVTVDVVAGKTSTVKLTATVR